jgi:hypothetical protein
MPNGGSDCCGTCWFNSKNEGKPGYHNSNKKGIVLCTIRNIEISDPFYTYCINHPHHNPTKISVPLGGIYTGEDRKLLVNAPDNEETRLALVELLEKIEETPVNEYPAGRSLDEEIIVQIGLLLEKRAVPKLKQIVKFNPLANPVGDNPFNKNRIITVGLSIEVLAKLIGNEAMTDLERLSKIGLTTTNNYDPKQDKFAPIRYHVIRGLKNCDGKEAINLLIEGLKDPHQEIKAFSKDILEEKIGEEKTEELIKDMNKNSQKTPRNNWWGFWKQNK